MIKLVLFCGCLMFIDSGRSLTTGTSSRRQEPPRKAVVQHDDPNLSQVLLKISFDGGLVPDKNNVTGGRPGHSEFVVTREGNYSFRGDVRPKKKGVLTKWDLDELVRQIHASDFVALKSKKFTGECPTAYDGDEATYTFYTKAGVEVIASCTVAIDEKSALFLKVWEILEKYRR